VFHSQFEIREYLEGIGPFGCYLVERVEKIDWESSSDSLLRELDLQMRMMKPQGVKRLLLVQLEVYLPYLEGSLD
jgi:hypothetical protein